MKTPVLETERLILRPLSMDDAPNIQKYFNNWNVIKNLNSTLPWPYPEEGAVSFINEHVFPGYERDGFLLWGISRKAQPDEVIGVIEFHMEARPVDGNRGFWLAEPYWGRGFMSEAVAATQDYVFFELGLDKITVVNDMSNPASRRVKEKNGAQFVKLIDGEGWDGPIKKEVWEITAADWKKFRQAEEG